MSSHTKGTMDELKEIPSEILERTRAGTRAFLDRLRRPFEGEEDVNPPQHVVPREEAWAVLPQGSTRATKLFNRKEEAVEAARKTARQQKSVLIVHRKDGTVQEVRNYRSS